LSKAIVESDWPELARLAREFTHRAPPALDRVAKRLESAVRCQVPLQPCIRDVWHDHVLFTGEQVSGLIDFGAMRVDNIACDIARLVGSFVADDVPKWSAAVAAYSSIRPLSDSERELVAAFDQSTVLLGGLNWVRWIYVEGRSFPDRRRVAERLSALLGRLRHLAS
jgi:homoserine kinase type II